MCLRDCGRADIFQRESGNLMGGDARTPGSPVYRDGLLVVHPTKSEWGPGRILDVQGSKVIVYFRDLSAADPESAVRTLDTKVVSLAPALLQSDPFLDHLPPYVDGKFQRPIKQRVTLQEGIDKFGAHYPLFFDDPAYIGDAKTGERTYKWLAHELFERTLGAGQLEKLLSAGQLDEVRKRALSVQRSTNFLARFEAAAFSEGLQDEPAARRYFEALLKALEEPSVDEDVFSTYLRAVDGLPSAGKTSPAKWTVATVLPYLADPDRFILLKPEVTQDCAARLTFDINYRPELNWLTYSKVLDMSRSLLEILRRYGARDFIDVQSFIWLIGAGWND
jgi:hypothetical protein